MNIGLVGPIDYSVTGNPGWHLITAGIRYLVRQVVPHPNFIPINMYEYDRSWHAADACCDVVIICGNPRFTLSEGSAFWEHDMWHRLHALHLRGVRVIDGWAGSAFPYTRPELQAGEMATALMYAPKRMEYLQMAALFHGRITRDSTMQIIYERAGAPSTLLPCSSWWAHKELGVQGLPHEHRAYDVVVPYCMDGHPEVIEDMRAAAVGSRVVAATWQDYEWARSHFENVELVSDPVSMLRLFAGARRVLSFRLHAAIPAASVGADVCAVSIDSRTDACDLFGGFVVVGFSELGRVRFDRVLDPDTDAVLDVLRTLLT